MGISEVISFLEKHGDDLYVECVGESVKADIDGGGKHVGRARSLLDAMGLVNEMVGYLKELRAKAMFEGEEVK